MTSTRKIAAVPIYAATVTALAFGLSAPAGSTTLGPNAAKDRAIAAAVNLTGKDLPGWKQTPDTSSGGDQQMSEQLAACAGAPSQAAVKVVDVGSPYFDSGNTEISSDVTMVRTRGDGTADLKAMRGARLLPCVRSKFLPYLRAQLPKGTAASGFTVRGLVASWLPGNSFGYRISLVLTVKKGTQTSSASLTSDAFGFLVGRAEVELDVSQVDGTPNQSLEQRLGLLLASRAHKYAAST